MLTCLRVSKVSYFWTVSLVPYVYKQKIYCSITQTPKQLCMRKFQHLLLLLKRSYICYHIICMTVPLLTANRNQNMGMNVMTGWNLLKCMCCYLTTKLSIWQLNWRTICYGLHLTVTPYILVLWAPTTVVFSLCFLIAI